VAGTEEQPVVTLVDTKKNFSRRPIDQIDIIKEIEVLVTLSGKELTVYCNILSLIGQWLTLGRRRWRGQLA
jgi:hypothetical protein